MAPCARRAADADLAAVVADDAVHDGEAEAGAARLGREVGREQLGARLVAEAGAVVGDLELDAAVDGARATRMRPPAGATHRVARVLDEVEITCVSCS